MAVLESFYSSIIFLILYDFAFINHGASQDVYDYAATLKLEKIESIPNQFFKVDGSSSDASFSILREIEVTNRIYFVDYSIDSARKTEMLAKVPLCEQMEQNDTSIFLRDQMFFKYLFLRERNCPVKQDKYKLPATPMEKNFDYGYIVSSNITCKPWKYKMELRFYNRRPFLSMTFNVDMKKKYKCDPNPSGESIWAKKLAEGKAKAKDQEKSDKGNS